MNSSSKALHHVAVGAQDVEHMATFYAQAFDLPERTRHHYGDGRLRSVWLEMGGTTLMIEHTDGLLRQVEGVGAGPFLLAFSVAGADERSALEVRLESMGAEIESRTQFTSYFRDPEGNRVAVSHYDHED
jgi:predicted enzyme related to lactoylglutathione lyase